MTVAPLAYRASTGNWRVDKILALAWDHGHAVETSEHTPGCWIIRGNISDSLTVFAEPNNAARVMADRSGYRNWDEVTQKWAMAMLAHKGLMKDVIE